MKTLSHQIFLFALKYTKEFYLLDDQEYAVVYKDHIDFYDNSLAPHSKAIKNIEWDATAAEKMVMKTIC